MLLDDSHMNLAIAESKLGSIKNEKEQELMTLKDKVCVCVCLSIYLRVCVCQVRNASCYGYHHCPTLRLKT